MGTMEIGWLPLGSVVLLEDENRPHVIVGRLQKSAETGRVYDYLGYCYPLGAAGGKHQALFDGYRQESFANLS